MNRYENKRIALEYELEKAERAVQGARIMHQTLCVARAEAKGGVGENPGVACFFDKQIADANRILTAEYEKKMVLIGRIQQCEEFRIEDMNGEIDRDVVDQIEYNMDRLKNAVNNA